MLELAALSFGSNTVMSVYMDISSTMCSISVKDIFEFSDSMIVLSWLRSNKLPFDKSDKNELFINNKLNSIVC